MQELLQQALEEIRSAARFRWAGMALAWLLALGGWTWVALQPDVYEAQARVFVDTSSALQPVLGDRIISPNVATQLAYIREALLGRAQLEAVARDTGLDASATSAAQYEDLIVGLQTGIQVQATRGLRDSADGVYNITYLHSEREKAVAVVSATLDNFVESTMGVNQTQRDTAERFLDDRVEEYEARLARAEQALADFNKRNAGRLPGTQGSYFARMQTERDALEAARRQLQILESRREELVAQRRGERLTIATAPLTGVPAANSLDARIREAETRLDTLLLEYTDRHPDVVAQREAFERMLAQRQEQLAALGVDGASLSVDDNPIYQALQMAINETDVDVATARADINQREERISELQSLVDEIPGVEAELARLNRDYDVVYEQYLALVRSRETQDLTRKASDTDQVEFRIINPPRATLEPVAPNRMLLLLGVFAAAMVAGGGVCFLLAQLRPVFSSATTLAHRAGLPVLGIVSYAWHDRRRMQAWRSAVTFATASLALVAVFVGLLGVETVGPGLRSMIG